MRVINNLKFFIENRYYPYLDFEKSSGLGKDHIRYLFEEKYLRKNSTGFISFTFVGVIAFKTDIIVCLPKYYKNYPNDDILLADVSNIIKVLKISGKSIKPIPDFHNLNSATNYTSEIVIADNLLRNYLEHGLFVKEYSLSRLNGNGEINWDLTIDAVTPIFSKNALLYVDTYTQDFDSDSTVIITELHKFYLKYYLEKYRALLNYKFSFSEPALPSLLNLGSQAFLINLVRKELNTTFSDNNIQLLRLLLASLDNSYDNGSSTFSIYGTGYFHVIWETVCSDVFDNRLNDFLDQIPSPTWNDLAGRMVEKKTLRPDIISIWNNRLIVLDAKYYDLRMEGSEELTVAGNPGVGDIIKQFLYEKALEDKGFQGLLNFLLFPTQSDSSIEIVGFVNMELFPSKVLWLCKLSANNIFSYYIDKRTFESRFMDELVHQTERLREAE